ncbi:GMC oxidoreductase [Amniculicola lignicola CBS 123094]|uniref:GMC oxidoreductase n=1 Tax=Amniculicola lignicola CBS 123094 TaxID=1392246 RepID=A0A6A5W4F6_9PLEO|nr:GMC oxidoreductase [Amniculicola lignicola CBS 123094]
MDPSTPAITPSNFSNVPFDVLIVGGGTAALVIAARLSALPSITVGVIEAGPKSFNDPVITVPGRFGESLGGEYDWKFETIPQAGLNGRSLAWPRGRVLGGTSALNFMTWTRGNREDFDAWEALGNEGWGWDAMLPYFKKTETLHQSSASHQATHQSLFTAHDHGTQGPVPTVYLDEFSEPHRHWHATLNALGLETNKNHFSGSNIGAFTSLVSVHPTTRTRVSSATAYYEPCAGRENLYVLTNATAEKIELEKNGDGEGEEWVAKGVWYSCNGERYLAHASREVIVCAGSVQSPQLLELSGIGNPDILRAAGIPVKVANPNVGENLQEHMMTAMIYELPPTLTGPDQLRANPSLAQSAQTQFKTSQSGIYATLPCALSYASLAQVLPPDTLTTILKDLPPPQTLREKVLYQQFTNPNRGQVEFLFGMGNWNPYFSGEEGKVYGTMLMMLQLPLSRGSIHIPAKRTDSDKLPSSSSSSTSPSASPSMKHPPTIDPKYFAPPTGPIDLAIMSQAQRFADKICRTAPLSSIIQRRVFPPEPGLPPSSSPPSPSPSPEQQKQQENFTPWIHSSSTTDWHPIGTCSMGGSLGRTVGVIDARLRVYNVKGLRVADASIMPLHICSHPQATIYAIGEKAAGLVLQDWGLVGEDGGVGEEGEG